MGDLKSYIPYKKPRGLSKGYKTNLALLHKFAMAQHGFIGNGKRQGCKYTRAQYMEHYSISANFYAALRRFLRDKGGIDMLDMDMDKKEKKALLLYWENVQSRAKELSQFNKVVKCSLNIEALEKR